MLVSYLASINKGHVIHGAICIAWVLAAIIWYLNRGGWPSIIAFLGGLVALLNFINNQIHLQPYLGQQSDKTNISFELNKLKTINIKYFAALLSIIFILLIASQYIAVPNISYFGIAPRFESLSVTPKEIDFVPKEITDEDGISDKKMKPNVFNYGVESSSSNVVLFVAPPNSDSPSEPIRPTYILPTSYNLYRLEWRNITLDFDDIGEGKYWFVADGYYKSPIKSGPKITTFVQSIHAEVHNDTSQGRNFIFSININGYEDRAINFLVSDDKRTWRVLGDTQVYIANSGPKTLVWEYWWSKSKRIPMYFKFDID